jgi:C4-dicarboxylate transporter DctQ subunit
VRFFDRAVASAAFALTAAGVLCVVAMTIVITYEVALRYLFNAPTMWADEIASYLLIAIVFLGLAQNLRQGTHIRIDVITSLVSPRTQQVLEIFAYAIGIVFSAMLAVGTWTRFDNFWIRHTSSDSPLMTPLWLPMVPVVLGAVVLSLAMIAGFVSTSHALLTGRLPPVEPAKVEP